jgi:hypothetical protein
MTVVTASVFCAVATDTLGKNEGKHDVSISMDYRGAVNGIKITLANDSNELIGSDDHLIIGNTYHISYKVVNEGNFDESVHIDVLTGEITLTKHNWSMNAGSPPRYGDDTWDTTGWSSGKFAIIVRATIPADDDLSNNVRSRLVTLDYPVK